jgi:hypothetical protein
MRQEVKFYLVGRQSIIVTGRYLIFSVGTFGKRGATAAKQNSNGGQDHSRQTHNVTI